MYKFIKRTTMGKIIPIQLSKIELSNNIPANEEKFEVYQSDSSDLELNWFEFMIGHETFTISIPNTKIEVNQIFNFIEPILEKLLKERISQLFGVI